MTVHSKGYSVKKLSHTRALALLWQYGFQQYHLHILDAGSWWCEQPLQTLVS